MKTRKTKSRCCCPRGTCAYCFDAHPNQWQIVGSGFTGAYAAWFNQSRLLTAFSLCRWKLTHEIIPDPDPPHWATYQFELTDQYGGHQLAIRAIVTSNLIFPDYREAVFLEPINSPAVKNACGLFNQTPPFNNHAGTQITWLDGSAATVTVTPG